MLRIGIVALCLALTLSAGGCAVPRGGGGAGGFDGGGD